MRYNPVMRGIDSVTGVRERRLRGTRYSNGDARLSVGSTIRDGAAHYAARVSEPQGAWPSEKDLCDAWESGAGHRRGQRLRTVTGSTVDVIRAGIRNSGDGPDFLGAVIAIESHGLPRRIIRGDVEMHLRATDWFAHGHETNPAFASVVLHVVEDAQEMVEIAGAPVLEVGHSTRRLNYKTTATMPKLLDLGAGEARDAAMMLDALGDARLEERAAAMEGDIAFVGPEQALYEALFRGLGYTRNMTTFQEVARLMPIETLRGLSDGAPDEQERVARLTGLLFGTAGLLPSQRSREMQGRFPLGELTWSAFDSFTVSSETEWARHTGLEFLARGSWQIFRVRPDNHPVRRMGAAVELVLRWFQGPGLLNNLRVGIGEAENPRDAAARVIDALVIPSTGYWETHSDFGKLRRSRPSALIGRGRALDIIATAVLPFLLAVADLESNTEIEHKTRQTYAVLPNTGESEASRRARHLLGRHSQQLSARRYQGFLSLAASSMNGARESLYPSGG